MHRERCCRSGHPAGDDPNGLPRIGTVPSRDRAGPRDQRPAALQCRYRARVTASAALHSGTTVLRAPVARRALVHGLVIGGLAFLVYTFAVAAPRMGTVGFDAFAYWNAQSPDPT